jgi:hypothetical protein
MEMLGIEEGPTQKKERKGRCSEESKFIGQRKQVRRYEMTRWGRDSEAVRWCSCLLGLDVSRTEVRFADI